MSKRSLLAVGFAALACVSLADSASASIVFSATSNLSGLSGNYTDASSIPVSSTDLINGLAPSATNYSGCCETLGGTTAPLTDGSTGSGPNDPTFTSNALFDLQGQGGSGPQPWYAVYDLGSSTAIGSVIVTTGHQDDRVNQHYDILVSNDGTNFTSLSDSSAQTVGGPGAGFVYTPSGGSGGAAQSTISDNASSILATARFVEFIALNLGTDVYREVDVIKAVPEPATVVLFGLGALGLLAAARRRRTA